MTKLEPETIASRASSATTRAAASPRGTPSKGLPAVGEVRGQPMAGVGCAQGIDARDSVMDKLDRPRSPIRDTSQDALAGASKRRLLRPRAVIYPALIVIAAAGLAWTAVSRAGAVSDLERVSGPSFVDLGGGQIAAQVHLAVDNDSDAVRRYTITLADAPDATLRLPQPTWQIAPRRAIEIPLFVDVARTTLVRGERRVHLRIDDDAGFERIIAVTLRAPDGAAP